MDDVTIYACDGKGGAVRDGAVDTAAFTWTHVRVTSDAGMEWLAQAELPPVVRDALIAPETRPRCTSHHNGVVLILRGVNLNPGSEPEDMISLRLWVTATGVVSTFMRPLRAVEDAMSSLERGHAPEGPADLVARIALRLADRAEPVVSTLNERVDALEEAVIEGHSPSHTDLADVRRVAIMLRRYLFPQRDALSSFEIEDVEWITSHDRSRLREATDRMTRLAEELDALRDRAQVVNDQLVATRAEVMNKQMLVLSVVAAVFLPLGLLTGLLGINVGGVPGADSPAAFWVVTGGLVVIGLALVWLFRALGWFRR